MIDRKFRGPADSEWGEGVIVRAADGSVCVGITRPDYPPEDHFWVRIENLPLRLPCQTYSDQYIPRPLTVLYPTEPEPIAGEWYRDEDGMLWQYEPDGRWQTDWHSMGGSHGFRRHISGALTHVKIVEAKP